MGLSPPISNCTIGDPEDQDNCILAQIEGTLNVEAGTAWWNMVGVDNPGYADLPFPIEAGEIFAEVTADVIYLM